MPINKESQKLPQRQLGRNGPYVSCLGLGCMGMSEFYGESNEADNLNVLERALDLGCNFWDTADMYGSGANEELIAKVLKTRRNEIFLCTKFAVVRDAKYGNDYDIRGDKEYVHAACNDSLKRLGIDKIDLYYQGRVDPKTPIEETVAAMSELIAQGKVRYLGLSECSAETLRRAYKVHPIHAVEIEYSPWETQIENSGLLDACKELGVSIVAYSPLGRGFLTGAMDNPEGLSNNDFRKSRFPKTSPENFEHNLKLVRKLEAMAKKKNVKPSQLCLSWILAQGPDFIPIPGTKRIKYLEENVASAFINLTKKEDLQVREIVNESNVQGDRYNAQEIKAVSL